MPDYAEQENKKLDEKKTQICADAREKVRAIADKATEDAARLDVISPLDLDKPADQRILTLLNGQFDLSVENLNHLISEHIGKTDYTLLNAVSVYCQNHGLRLIRATAETRRSGIIEVRDSALSLIGQISAQKAENQRGTLNMPMLVADFCTDSDFGRELCGRLGQTFAGEIISPTVEPENPLNLHFRGVRADEPKAG